MDERIRDLCSQLLRIQDSDIAEAVGEQFRSAIHEHVQYLRHGVDDLPVPEALLAN
jgi:hypothetical protein